MNKIILSKISLMGLIVISLGLSIASSDAGRSKDGHDAAPAPKKKSSSKKPSPFDALLAEHGLPVLNASKPASPREKSSKKEKPTENGEKKAPRTSSREKEKKTHKSRPKLPPAAEPVVSGVTPVVTRPAPAQPPRPSSGRVSQDVPPVETLRPSSRPSGSGGGATSLNPLDQLLLENGFNPLGENRRPGAKPRPTAGISGAPVARPARPSAARPSAAGPSRAPREVDDRWTIGMVEQVLRNQGLTLPHGVNTSADDAYWTASDVLGDLQRSQNFLHVLHANPTFREEIQHALTYEYPLLLETSLTNLCKQSNCNPRYKDALRHVRADRLFEGFAVLEALGYIFEPDSKYAMHKKFKEFERDITAYVNDGDSRWGAGRLGELFEREWIEPLTPLRDRDYPDYRHAGLGYRLMCALDRSLLHLDDPRDDAMYGPPYYELIQEVLRSMGLNYTPLTGEVRRPGEAAHYNRISNGFAGQSEASTKGSDHPFGFETRAIRDIRNPQRFLGAFPREPLAPGDRTPVARLSEARVHQEKVNQLTLDERVRPWLSKTQPPKMVSWHENGKQWIPVKWSAREGKLIEDTDDNTLRREGIEKGRETWEEAYERLVPWAAAWETAPRVEWPEPTGF